MQGIYCRTSAEYWGTRFASPSLVWVPPEQRVAEPEPAGGSTTAVDANVDGGGADTGSSEVRWHLKPWCVLFGRINSARGSFQVIMHLPTGPASWFEARWFEHCCCRSLHAGHCVAPPALAAGAAARRWQQRCQAAEAAAQGPVGALLL